MFLRDFSKIFPKLPSYYTLLITVMYTFCGYNLMYYTNIDWLDTVASVAKDGAYELNLYSDADVRLPGLLLEVRGGYPVSDVIRIRAVADRAALLRVRVPNWSKTVRVDGQNAAAANGRCEIRLEKGSFTHEIVFDMTPRILDSEAPGKEDVKAVVKERNYSYTMYFMTWNTPENKEIVRDLPAAQVMRGPLVLAKGRLAGTSREETFAFKTVNRGGWRASLEPAPRTASNAAAWGCWTLTFEKDGEKRMLPVADFWSVSNVYDPQNWYSVWF